MKYVQFGSSSNVGSQYAEYALLTEIWHTNEKIICEVLVFFPWTKVSKCIFKNPINKLLTGDSFSGTNVMCQYYYTYFYFL